MTPRRLDGALLRDMPLPRPEAGSKDGRGSVLVVAGSPSVPGAALLAGVAALRAGAGKLAVATAERAALPLGLALPEAMTLGLPEADDGGVEPRAAAERLRSQLGKVDGLLVGPGMTEGAATAALTAALVAGAGQAGIILDAAALCDLRPHADAVRAAAVRLVITPHAGEMAQLLERSREAVEDDPADAARAAATLLGAVVVMKGATSLIQAPDGPVWRYEGGGVGLATSGSGDVLAGLIAGLLARGTEATAAALWGVALHGEAGRRLAEREGPLGFLARDLAAEVPRLLVDFGSPEIEAG